MRVAGLHDVQAGVAVTGLQHRVAEIREHLDDDHPHGKLVLDQQHDGARLRMRSARPPRQLRLGRPPLRNAGAGRSTPSCPALLRCSESTWPPDCWTKP